MRNNSYQRMQVFMTTVFVVMALFLLFVFSVSTQSAMACHKMNANLPEINAAPPTSGCMPKELTTELELQPLDVPLDTILQHEISLMCLDFGVPFEVEMRLIEHESSFDPNAMSRTDDHGLAQINRRKSPTACSTTTMTPVKLNNI